MPNKKYCKKCDTKHVPPTRRNCKITAEEAEEDNVTVNELYRDAAVSSEVDGVTYNGQQVQLQILQQLERVTKRLDKVEDRMTAVSPTSPQKLSTSKLSTSSVTSSVKKVKSKRKSCVYTDLSSDSDTPSLDVLKSPQLQKRVDRRIRELTHSSHCSGTDVCGKFKSKTGGNVNVTVKTKVAWPHETVFGGASRQCINYDQLSLTQWVHGFCENILDEPSVSRRDAMVSYMGDLMEDASDFSWQGAKAANTVLLCEMERDNKNHSSAIEYPNDVEAYIKEETEHQAILGPFTKNPIPGGHCSPFITRSKPNSDRRRVIIDLSWPIGESVNAGIDKNMYLGSQFDLNFPSVDHITEEAKRFGRGALLYKVDVSRAFCHVKVDPGDYDLLGLQWDGTYVDTCLPFGTHHGRQSFQRISDTVRYMMHQKGFCIIDYIDDYIGVGVPSVAHASYHSLLNLMGCLGLSVSQKKLVPPSTRATCLGVLIDTDAGTI